MKKKIIIGLGIFSLVFVLVGVYTIVVIEHATTELDKLIQLHQVEILREHLLIEVKRTQSDLYLKNTRHARSIDTIVSHVRTMGEVVNTCFDCHHNETVMRRLHGLKGQIEDYKSALSRVFTIRANVRRLQAEEDSAYKKGTELISELDTIITMTNKKLGEKTDAAFAKITHTKMILYILLATVPLAAIGLSAFFLRGLTRPVTELLAATRRLKGGDLGYRIEGLSDEFGEVAASFNEMAGSLRDQCQKMQWAEQLVVLGELAGGLAHEIKNPLAGIKASMEVLSDDPSLSGENKDVFLKVLDQIKRIEALLKTLLNFARPPKPHFMLTGVNSVLDASIDLALRHPLFSARDSKPIGVKKDYDARLPETMADPLQLQQVFMNLLLNAADAMPDGGMITVQTAHEASVQSLRITITDSGKGIEETVIDRIFQPFFTTKTKGTGLGLSITKRLIEQHGGSIRVQNSPDRGASFTIMLPVRLHAEEHDA
ncbi:MAG TPA: ATP-binding protein [Nitrospirota bacterium]|nr:ATP-binding protein [Nitrospirota bacterium]